MIFFKAPDNSVHAIESIEFLNYLPKGCIEIDKATAEKLAQIWNDENLLNLDPPK